MRRIALMMALVAGLLTGVGTPPGAEAAPRCGRDDRPETGIAGDVPLADQQSGRADEGYNCGLSLVGYNSLHGRGGNANMTWAGPCAYISGDGVAVVDVTDPAHPKHIKTLHGSGSDASIETLHAVVTPERSILVTGRYGVGGATGFGGPTPVDVWDVHNCRSPKLLSTFTLPWNAHNLTLSADAKTMWNTLPLEAVDLTDPRHPRYLGSLEDQLRAQGNLTLQMAHEAWPSPDGKRLYVGGQEAVDEKVMVIDVEGWPARPARIVGQTASPGHGIRPATIDGKQYLVNSDESIVNLTAKGCLPDLLTPFGGASQPYLTDISKETSPEVVSQFRLPINEPAHCLDQLASGVNASVHYQEVDDYDDTTFVMASMWNAGLRVIDVRDPRRPTEVAYFNPGRFAAAAPSEGSGIDGLMELQS
ncbi:MAG: LVIVD repeat-containing protein, partial [Acidimicrobiales bacterium]